MLNLSVIILTYNEEVHIRRCIDNIKEISKDIYIVDSFSTDNTKKIAESLGVKVYENKWENNYSKQFNWALTNLPINTEWVLRLDADEYLTPELINELTVKLENLESNISGIVIKRRHIFLGKWIRRGMYPVKLLRLFRYKKAICEVRFMDEHIELLEGHSEEFEYDFIDNNLNNITWWTNKHANYAIREAIDLLNMEQNYSINKEIAIGEQAKSQRSKKQLYVTKSLFIRAFMYFLYRYIIKLGFLDGKEGFLWHFLQGWWYRTLVDIKVYEIKRECGCDKEKIINFLLLNYKIDCREYLTF